jgi:hypothetical protein
VMRETIRGCEIIRSWNDEPPVEDYQLADKVPERLQAVAQADAEERWQH